MQTDTLLEKDVLVKINPGRKKKNTVHMDLAFPRGEYEDRLRRVRMEMDHYGLAAKIVTNPRDFGWLTGSRVDYWASESPQWLIIPRYGEPVAIVRRLEEETHRYCNFFPTFRAYPDAGPINPFDPVQYAVQVIKELGHETARIGLNAKRLNHEDYVRFETMLPCARFTSDLRIENIRTRRSPREIACIRQAVQVNQDALSEMITCGLHRQMSEWGILKKFARLHRRHLEVNRISVDGEHYQSAMGSTCVQVGEHMMHMHAARTPTEQKSAVIPKNGPCGVWLEPGFFIKDYVGCMVRTVWFGVPPREATYAVEACCAAFDRLVEILAPGITAGEADNAVRPFLASKNLDMRHRSGYMSNEKWQEGGILSITPENPLVLQVGQVFHCPIHVYVPGVGYMGVSEQVLITETGCEVLGDMNRTCARKLFIKN